MIRDGLSSSSKEASVMGVERRAEVIQYHDRDQLGEEDEFME